MVYSTCIENEIRIWWDPRHEFTEGCLYRVTLDETARVFTDKVYYNFKNIRTDVKHFFTIEVFDENGNALGKAEKYETENVFENFKTVNVTESPYGAKGDGETDCTQAVRLATENAEDRTCVYFPLGIYRADKITVNGTLKLRFDRGAIVTDGEEK